MWAGVTDRWSPSADHFGSRETHSGIYRTGGSDGDVIVGTYDLAGSEKHGLPFSLSGDRTRLVLLSVCDRLYTEPVFPGTCGTVQNVECSKITYLLLLFLNEIYWIGWLRQLLEKRAEQTTGQLTIQKWAIRNGAAAWWFYALIGVACLVIFRASSNQAGHYSSYGAYYYVHTGEAYNFHQEYLERVAILSGPEKMCSCRPISSARGFCAWEKSPRMRTMRPTVLWPCGTIKTV